MIGENWRRRRSAYWAGILSIVLGLGAVSSPLLAKKDIWANLKQGGHVVLMRHTTAEAKGDPLKLNDCSVQRKLSRKGRFEALRVGRLFRRHGVPINAVLSSRYCRTQETARLAFGRVATWEPLDLLYAVDDSKADTRTDTVTKRISAFKGKGNLVLVTHKPNIEALTLELIPPGSMLVLKPDGRGGFKIISGFAVVPRF